MKKIYLIITLATWVSVGAYSQQFENNKSTPLTIDNYKSFGNGWIDYDGDGDEDLFVVNMNDHNSLFQNLGNGQFKKLDKTEIGSIVEDEGASFTTTWADFNGDGLLDVFVGNFGEPSFLYAQDENHRFIRVKQQLFEQNSAAVQASSWVDFDLDDDLDLFLGTKEQSNQLFENNGKDGFKLSDNSTINAVITNSHGVAWSDINNDNYPDLYLAENVETGNLLYLSEKGIFKSQNYNDDGFVSIGASWVDIDNDSDMDLFVTNAMGKKNFLFLNEGDGVLKKIESNDLLLEESNSMGACWGDYDNDGDLDVFIANSGNQINSLYINQGSGQFKKIGEKSFNEDANSSRGCSCGDYDNDGDLDLFVSNGFGEDDHNNLYTNTGNTNNWIKLKLIGKQMQAPIGAKVSITATDKEKSNTQLREISSQSGAYGHNSYIVHFGLGKMTEVKELKVKWPNGEIQSFTNLLASKNYILIEGKKLEENKE